MKTINPISKDAWNPKIEFTKVMMDKRIRTCLSFFGWEHTIQIIKNSGRQIDKLEVAEIGSGTGTFSLTLALLGAKVTLIDYNPEVLSQARKIYKFYNCDVDRVCADILESPPHSLKERFDLVVSLGLAEHFTEDNRKECFIFHRDLLKRGGFAVIGVPNRLSPFYMAIWLLRNLTKTWKIPEVPFSSGELKRLARDLRFKSYYVIGLSSLIRDFVVYPRGVISAVIDILPKSCSRILRKWHSKMLQPIRKSLSPDTDEDMVEYCQVKANLIQQGSQRILKNVATNNFNSNIILFAFK